MPISAKVLEDYCSKSNTFIETGTHTGDGVQAALSVGFTRVISCDLESPNNPIAAERFKGKGVDLRIGDSRQVLREVLKSIVQPAVFWLDAHATDGGAGAYSDCPLLGELAEIANHRLNNHTILIDDARLIGSDALRLDPTSDNYSMWKLLDAIRNINPDYNVNLIHSPLFCFDIIACTP